jgi:hypothetical protein
VSNEQEKQGTGDREWLYEEVLDFIGRSGSWEVSLLRPDVPKSDRMIYQHFCGMHGTNTGRSSWDKKKRHTKRAMLRSALRRLVDDGRIKVVREEDLNLKTMNGTCRRNIEHRRRMFGKDFDGKVRTYLKLSVLEGIVEALGSSDG